MVVLPMPVALSPRLRAVAAQVLAGQPMVDVGTDHAHLPVHLVQSGHVPRAFAIDCRPGPLAAATATLERFGITDVELQQGYGLTDFTPGAAGTIVIAGMGGDRIQSILTEAPRTVASSARLVLQPNSQWPRLRRWLGTQGWHVVAEHLVQERRHFYLVLAVDPRIRRPYSLTLGQSLLGNPSRHDADSTYERWLQREIAWRSRALELVRSPHRSSDGADKPVSKLREELTIFTRTLAQTSVFSRRGTDTIG